MGSIIAPFLLVTDPAGLGTFLERTFGSHLGRPRNGDPCPHRVLRVEDSQLEVAAASTETTARRAAIHVYVPDVEAVYSRGLTAGAKSLREPVVQPYGDREASFEDLAGNHWYIATHLGASFRPEGLRTITPYFHVENCTAWIDEIARAFGAIVRESHASPDGVVQHAKVAIDGSVVEASESGDAVHPQSPAIRLYIADAANVRSRALAAGLAAIDGHGVRDRAGQAWYLRDLEANHE